jgi:hypothetical protein
VARLLVAWSALPHRRGRAERRRGHPGFARDTKLFLALPESPVTRYLGAGRIDRAEENQMPKGQEKPKTNNKPKLTAKEKKEKKKQKKAAAAGN